MKDIGLILLAAGGSTRMGRPKQLLPFRGTTLLRHAALRAVETGFTPIIVVLGAEAESSQIELKNLPVNVTVNPAWESGMGSSIRTGIDALLHRAPQTQAALIMLHDQPLIPAAKLLNLARSWNPPEVVAVASEYAETFGVPALFDRSLFRELAALTGKQGAYRILESHLAQLAKVPIPEAVHDIDSAADYERLREVANDK